MGIKRFFLSVFAILTIFNVYSENSSSKDNS
ncbi:MAG: hypothetical protein H6Q20_2171, partial [Bacteroidetes bacterium]|nr:hypothetical protein [Bacteroidota bacterium]